VLALALLALAGCATSGGIAPQSRPHEAETLASTQTLGAAPVVPARWPTSDWWTTYNDRELDRLLSQALEASPTLAVVAARTRVALAEAGAAESARYPEVNLSGSLTREHFPEHSLIPPPFAGSWSTLSDLKASLAFELDFWGKNRAAYERAIGEARATALDAQAARLALSASIAREYIELERAYLLLDVAQTTLDEREQIYRLSSDRSAAGIDSRLELKQAESALPAAREQIIVLRESIGHLRNGLAALIGQGPDRGLEIGRPTLAELPTVSLPTRVPSELLGRRPDILALRWRIEAARSGIDNARAQFYPDIDLNAFIGLQNLSPADFLTAASRQFGVGPALSLPIFDAGRRRANLSGRDAEFDIAVEQYNQALADALREVVDPLTTLQSVAAQRSEQRQALATAQDAYDLALLRYREGVGNYLQVLTTHAQLLAQRSLEADLRARALEASVDLTQALGGGSDAQAAAPEGAADRIEGRAAGDSRLVEYRP
jgi:NodT family efflux transporter outer membrane factor (OMF) lipoprotein